MSDEPRQDVDMKTKVEANETSKVVEIHYLIRDMLSVVDGRVN